MRLADDIPLDAAMAHFTARRIAIRRRVLDERRGLDSKGRKRRRPLAEVVLRTDLVLLCLERCKGFAVVRGIRIRDEGIAGIEALHVVGVERDVLLGLVDDGEGRREDRLVVMRLGCARLRVVSVHLDALLAAAEHELPLLIRRRDIICQRDARERVLVVLRL